MCVHRARVTNYFERNVCKNTQSHANDHLLHTYTATYTLHTHSENCLYWNP